MKNFPSRFLFYSVICFAQLTALPLKIPDSDNGKKKTSTPENTAIGSEPFPFEAPNKGADEKILTGLKSGGGTGKLIYVIELKGVIDLGIAPFLTRQLNRASAKKAALFILDIDTPGGRVDAALKIRDALLNSKVKTVAFIHPRAISAGALISYACDIIAISTGGTMGAATPLTVGPGGSGASAVNEKMMSYFRTEMVATARAKGRRGDIAEAMVDKDIEIKGVVKAGKLLTLDTDMALKLNVADLKADSIDQLLKQFGLEGARITRPRMSWAEHVARWLTHPVVSSLLMSIGILAILMELYTPGFGIAGITGIMCLALFFFGHLVVKLAGMEEMLLLAIGLTLLSVELFVTPGFGIVGAAGIACIIASFVLALTGLPISISIKTGMLTKALLQTFIAISIPIAIFILLIRFLPGTRVKTALLDKAVIAATAYGNQQNGQNHLKAGTTGTAHSPLRPSGRGKFGSTITEVIAEGSFIDEGAKIRIIKIEGPKIIVREAEKDEEEAD